MKNPDISTAFDAMFIFLEEYWKRGGESSDDIAVLLGSLGRHSDNLPMDIALWEDWTRAYDRAKSNSDSNSGDADGNYDDSH